MNHTAADSTPPPWLVAFNITMQMIVTIVLIVFAYAVREGSGEMAGIVVGAAVGHWLKESVIAGRNIATTKKTPSDDATSPENATS